MIVFPLIAALLLITAIVLLFGLTPERILLNAYGALDEYSTFDFSTADSLFGDVQTAIDAIMPKTIGNNDDVPVNKERTLIRLDEAGINDGHVVESADVIDDEITDKEKDLAAITASFKTLDVLGQILQNYPGEIDGKLKVEIVDEIHKLGMRSVQAIIKTMGYLEDDLVAFILERAAKENKNYRRDEVASSTRKFINMLLSGMVRGMINKVAISLNSKYILPAAKEALEYDSSISSKIVLLELKINCLKIVDYQEIVAVKKEFEQSNDRFALSILGSIVGYYLNYNKCDFRLRAKLCTLFNFSEKHAILNTSRNLLEQGY